MDDEIKHEEKNCSVFEQFQATETFKAFREAARAKAKSISDSFKDKIKEIQSQAEGSDGEFCMVFGAEYNGKIKRDEVQPQDLELFEQLVKHQGREEKDEVQFRVGGALIASMANCSKRFRLATMALDNDTPDSILGLMAAKTLLNSFN